MVYWIYTAHASPPYNQATDYPSEQRRLKNVSNNSLQGCLASDYCASLSDNTHLSPECYH